MIPIREVQDALRKQEPMKPRYIDVGLYECKICDGPIDIYHNYCSYCGKKIDWGSK